MAVDLNDIMQGIENHLAAHLSSVDASQIVQAYPDDRVEDREDAPDTEVSFSIYDFRYDAANEYSGYFFTDEKDEQAGTTSRTRKPIPYRLYIQVDTYCRRKLESRQIMLELESLFASQKDITTPAGGSYWPMIEPGDNQDDMLEGDAHRVHRFSIPVWLPDAHVAQQLGLVLEANFGLNLEDLTLEVNP